MQRCTDPWQLHFLPDLLLFLFLLLLITPVSDDRLSIKENRYG